MVDDAKKKTNTQGHPKKVHNQQSQQKVEKGYQEKKETGDTPMLRFGTASNNFLKFKEALSTAALIQFGDVAKLLELDKYNEIPMPDEDDYEVVGRPAMGKRLYDLVCMEWVKSNNRMKEKHAHLYGFIWKHMSLESRDKIKEERGYDTWSQEKDAEKLWQAIIATHKVNMTSNVSALKQRSAWVTYVNCRQGGFKSLISYKERFIAAYKNYKDEGNPEKDDKARALDFFDGLDKVLYGDFKNHILNCIDTGTLKSPEDVATVHGWVANWRKTHQMRERLGTGTAFVTTGDSDTEKKTKKELNPEEKLAKIKCFRCKEKGHRAPNCPHKNKRKEDDAQERQVTVTWVDARVFTTYDVYNATDSNLRLGKDVVLLDTQANISLFHPSVLENVKPSEKEIKINGIGGYQMTIWDVGYLPNFFDVYCSLEVKVNVLCFAEVEDLFEIEYREREGFVMQLPNGKEIIFERKNKMFVADIVSVGSVLTTIAEKKIQYSTADVKKVEMAYELLKNAGYPLAAELINLVGDGNVMDRPALTRGDIIRAYEIFGQPPEYVRGKLTKKKVSRVNFDAALCSQDPQTLWADVMHIDQKLIFVSVAEPMQLVMLNHIKGEDAESLGEALQDQLGLLREGSFEPTLVYVDPASGLMSLRTQFPGIVIDPCGAGDFVSKIDISIRQLKEMYRTVKAGIPWTLPKSRVKDLMMYCVSRMNLRRTSALDGTVCPKVLFTGLNPNYRKELSLAFGDYVEVHTGTDNTSRERSVPCIALYPIGNAMGTWQFWNLRTKRYMRHSTWVRMRSSELTRTLLTTSQKMNRIQESKLGLKQTI